MRHRQRLPFLKTRPAEELASFVCAIPDAAAVLEAGPRMMSMRYVNRPLIELLGYREEELVGRPVELLFHDKDLFSFGIERKLLATGEAHLETHLAAKDGKKIPVSFSVKALGGGRYLSVAKDLSFQAAASGEFRRTREELSRRIQSLEEFRSGVFQILKDLDENESELKEAYEKLKSTQAQLIQSSKLTALGELAACLAHELNQPLTVILGLTQNTMKHLGPETPEREKLGLVFEAAKKMENIVKHLRVFSRIDEPAFTRFDMNSVIGDAFLMLKELLRRTSIEVRTHLNPVPEVYGSATRLEQVIINLVTNARDAMPEGGVLGISTSKASTDEGECVVIKVTDTGKGIPEELLGKIFDPFFTTKEPGKGTGLGLSISYGIVKEHGGDIKVETGPGGTAFTITLPARPSKTASRESFGLPAKIRP